MSRGALPAAVLCLAVAAVPMAEPEAADAYLFGPVQRVATGGKIPRSVEIGDLDADGRPEIVVANAKSDTLSVLVQRARGQYTLGYRLPTGVAPHDVALADVDEDGRLDAVTETAGSGRLEIMLNRDGRLVEGSGVAIGGPAYALADADFDGDGHVDFVVSVQAGGGGALYLLRGDGQGGMSVSRLATTAGVALDLDAGDLNEDGSPDIVATIPGFVDTTQPGGGHLSILLSEGGSFGTPAGIAANGFDTATLGDARSDGHLDVTVTAARGGISTGFGTGTGAFSRWRSVPTGWEGTGQAALADVDRDGNLDLLVGVSARAEMLVYLGTGTGVWRKRFLAYPVGSYPDRVTLGDLNGDRRPDAVLSSEGSRIRILLANAECRVPALVARLLEVAERKLSDAGCRVGPIRWKRRQGSAPRLVAGQGIARGARLPLGARVPLIVVPDSYLSWTRRGSGDRRVGDRADLLPAQCPRGAGFRLEHPAAGISGWTVRPVGTAGGSVGPRPSGCGP